MSRTGRSYRGKLSSYTIKDRIGKTSGMGDVYVARNQNQKQVVIKFFKPNPDGDGGSASELPNSKSAQSKSNLII